MKYLVIGDIHGKIDHVETLLQEDFSLHHKIFVGDYADSFTHGRKKQKKVLSALVHAVKTREDVTCLLGNHEWSYLKEGMQCSGYSGSFHRSISIRYPELRTLFKKHFYIPDIALITHAGATGELFSSLEDVEAAIESDSDRLYNIGRSRGGTSDTGGIFWCDFWREFQEIQGLVQIVGHSSARPRGSNTPGIIKMNNCYNVDCLDRVFEVLEIDTERNPPMKVKNMSASLDLYRNQKNETT